MMPTFPRSPLSFRTAGFPQYGCKAGFPSGAFPGGRRLKRCSPHTPSDVRFSSALRAPRGRSDDPALCRAADSIAHHHGGLLLLRPRGPRSGPGYSVPVRHHLIDPIRPSRRHTAISPHGGLYAVPSLCGEHLGDPREVPGFRCPFFPDMPSSTTPGSSTSSVPDSDVDIGLRRRNSVSALPKLPQSVSRGGKFSRPWFTHLLRPASLLDALYGSDRSPGQRRLLHPSF